jgi:hypothetical protein
MADKVILEAEVKSNVGEVTKDVKKLDKATDKATGGFKGMGTAIKGMGTALKAAGIGLVVALLAKLMEVFSKNQRVLDIFNTSMTALSIAFNDLFRFLENNVGTVVGYFQSIFDDPVQSIKDFGTAIKDNIIERFNSWLDMTGFLASAVKKLFEKDFKGAMSDVKEAGKEMVDVWTGVDNTFDKVTETVTEYVTETIKVADAITETTKAADKAAVIFAKLNAEFLRDAELQRQIRDDETKTFAERIKANEDLSKVLEDQQKLQREQLDVQEKAAQAQYNINQSDENWIILQEAKVAKLELEETITGQLSEQKTNQVALEKELLETSNEVRAEGLSGMQRELQELEASYKQKLEMARKSGMDTTAIDKQFSKQKSQIIQEQVNTQLEAFSSLAGSLQSLAGESKELAIAQAIIDTYVGANKAYAQGGMVGFVSAAAVIVAGLANVKTIMEQDVGGGGGGSAGAAPQTPAPQMMQGAFTLGGGEAPEPARAYVVSDDITNNQNKLAIIRRRATI